MLLCVEGLLPASLCSVILLSLEELIALQLSDHLDSRDLNEPFQSAYRRLHSTETALVRVCSDIRADLDRKEGICLCYLT